MGEEVELSREGAQWTMVVDYVCFGGLVWCVLCCGVLCCGVLCYHTFEAVVINHCIIYNTINQCYLNKNKKNTCYSMILYKIN